MTRCELEVLEERQQQCSRLQGRACEQGPHSMSLFLSLSSEVTDATSSTFCMKRACSPASPDVEGVDDEETEDDGGDPSFADSEDALGGALDCADCMGCAGCSGGVDGEDSGSD